MNKSFAVITALTLAGASEARAQNASINATATVLAPITATAGQNLAFGTVFPGINKTIAYSDATGGGTYTVAGEPNKQVNLTFTLPTNLANGANTLAIDTWTGYRNTAASATVGGTAFTPSSSAQAATLGLTTGQLFVYLGATVKPTTTQVAGSYTAAVRMDVVYTGS